MTKNELLRRAEELEELGRSLIEHASLLRNQCLNISPGPVARQNIGDNLLVFTEVLLAAREHKLRHLDGKLFGEPAWEMLLFLFHAYKSGGCVTADQVCRSSGTFQATAQRWLTVLVDQELVETSNNAQSDAPASIRLTESGELRMTKVLMGMQREFLQHGWSAIGTT